MARVVVIGGGVAGLSLALWRAKAGDRVTLCEAGAELGGQLSTVREAGFIVEQGAEGFVAGSAAVAALAEEVGVATRVVSQLVTTSFGFDGAALHALGPGEAAQFLGFQVARRDLGQGIRAFQSGMAELIEALAHALGPIADVRVRTSVKGLTRQGGGLELSATSGRLEADRVYVATGARAAAALLSPELGGVAEALASAVVASSVTVSLAYPRAGVAHPLDGTGFVVAEAAQEQGLRACTFTSSKLPGRAPPDHALLRVFFRPTVAELATLDDAAWVARAEHGLARALSLRVPAEHAWVARWADALPVFDAVHEARVVALEAALAGSGIALAGAAFHGPGIDAALRSARRAEEHTV